MRGVIDLLVIASPDNEETARIIVLEDGQAVEYVPEWRNVDLHKHDLLLGVVTRHVPHLGGVFVDIGQGHDGLLRLKSEDPLPSIGSRIIITIKREAEHSGLADKGPILSNKIALAGRYAVYRPDQKPLRRSLLADLPPTEAESLFTQDLKQLEKRYAQIVISAGSGPAPRRLAAFCDPLVVRLQAFATRLKSIQVEGLDSYISVEQLLRAEMPDLLPLLKLHQQHLEQGLAELHGLPEMARAVSERVIGLPCGGSLTFDRTEAMHVIDVNSGSCRESSPAALAERVNSEAVKEIARQLRLRNLSGMIIIDLIHQKNIAKQEMFAEQLQEAVSYDRGRVTVYGFTALQLLEVIRQAH
jgi:ribonuclease G